MKKRFLLILLLAVNSAIVFGQSLNPEKIEKIIAGHPQLDTFRVNRLNQLAAIVAFPLDSAFKAANEALSISNKLNYDAGKGVASINLAFIKIQHGDKEGAVVMLQQVIDMAQKKGLSEVLSRAYLALGRAKLQSANNQQALDYFLKGESIAETLPDKSLQAQAQRVVSSFYMNSRSDYPKSMEWILRSINSAEQANNREEEAQSWSNIAAVYNIIGDHEKALQYYLKALDANKRLGNSTVAFNLLNNIGERYRLMGEYDKAITSYKEGIAGTNIPYNIELMQSNLADVYVKTNNLPEAFRYGYISLAGAKKIKDTEGEAWIDGVLGNAYLKKNNADSALYYGTNGLMLARQTGTIEFMRDNSGVLTKAYAIKKDFANAFKYQTLYVAYRDSMMSTQITGQTSLLQYNYDLAKKQAQIAELNQDKQSQKYYLIGVLIVLGLIAITVVILLRNNRQKQKANNLLSDQKLIIEHQRDQTNKALADLQLTQKQLIQSEKMASLGELTAGIAHEIQNPLNFVNNFSEVSMELVDEMELELNNGEKDEAISIAKDIKLNLEKIRHHGKRADGIVKGMLQHSRTGSTAKEDTDLNTVADEYLRLAYHGLRAKDKSFNTELVTSYDPALPKANVLPQEIGRVLLNLFTNAFYAVQQKQKNAGSDYKPTVELTTRAIDSGKTIEIKVKDNGAGIPAHIKDKIMQPFFTTKPTGEGTGLGLSLSYDIVVKGHNGKIDISTAVDEGSEFTITLPVT